MGGLFFLHEHDEPLVQRALCDVVREQCAQAHHRDACPPSEQCLVGIFVEEFGSVGHGFKSFILYAPRWSEYVGVNTGRRHGGSAEIEVIAVFRHAGIHNIVGISKNPAPVMFLRDVCAWSEVYIETTEKPPFHTLFRIHGGPRYVSRIKWNHVYMHPVDDLDLDFCEYLHGIVYLCRRLYSHAFLQLIIEYGVYSGSPYPSEVDGDSVWFLEVYCSLNTFSRSHGILL